MPLALSPGLNRNLAILVSSRSPLEDRDAEESREEVDIAPGLFPTHHTAQ